MSIVEPISASQIHLVWGAGPTPRYDEIAAPFRPIFARIKAGAVERDLNRVLPATEIGWLRQANFSKIRLPVADGGLGVTLPELFNLLIELGQADSNVVNALRAHFGFTEDLLNSPHNDFRAHWTKRVASGDTFGSGYSETGDNKLGEFSTKLLRVDGKWVVTGKKFYTTGSLFADWINIAVADANGEAVGGLVSTTAPGVEILDDWDGFGQALTASGTAIFKDVILDDIDVKPTALRFGYSAPYFQLVHLATLAGIARAAADEVSQVLSERARVYAHGNGLRAGDDPQLLAIVGRVRGNAYSAGAVVLQAAQSLERAYQTYLTGDAEAADVANGIATLEVSQSVTVVTNLVLEAATLLFDALGASAARRTQGLDRLWRNARTISSHNPRVYHDRAAGNFAVNGVRPSGPFKFGVGTPG